MKVKSSKDNMAMKKMFPLCIFFVIFIAVFASCSNSERRNNNEPIVVGISWRSDISSEFYTNIVASLKEVGAEPVLLDQVRNDNIEYTGNVVSQQATDSVGYLATYAAEALKKDPCGNSNVEAVAKGVDAIVFTGGEDISPTLYAVPQPWHGIEAERDYNATRDVNDYTLMSYCIQNDISAIGICRGMQVLGVVSGATVIQDIPTYFTDKGESYDYIHRNEKVGNAYRDYSPHNVTVNPNTILWTMTSTEGMFNNVPSWHHQAIRSVAGTPLIVSGYTKVNEDKIIEAIERSDCSILMGLQFHPEAVIGKWNAGAANVSDYMSKEEALKIFKVFVAKVKERKASVNK